jgi:hypothetical protein
MRVRFLYRCIQSVWYFSIVKFLNNNLAKSKLTENDFRFFNFLQVSGIAN